MKGDKITVVHPSWLNRYGISWFNREEEMVEFASPPGRPSFRFLCDKDGQTWAEVITNDFSWPKGHMTRWRESCEATIKALKEEQDFFDAMNQT